MRKGLSLLFVIFISILIVGCDKKSNIDDFVFSGSNLVEYKGTSVNVEIPESYEKDGTIIEVQSIKLGVFSNNSVIKSIVVPKGVTSLHQNMFSGCYNLQVVCCKHPQSCRQWASTLHIPLQGWHGFLHLVP